MKKMIKEINWKKVNKIILISQLLVFFIFGLYLALSIRTNIGPDEPHHLYVAKAYSKTWGVPENSPETYEFGDITSFNYLAHWVNARVLNVNIFGVDELHLLRITNLFFSTLTLLILSILSKHMIKEERYRVVPVILLANTLMFQFLSSVINYDNLTNLLAVLSILYVVKIIKKPEEVRNYSFWIVFASLGALAKFTIFPLALIEALLVFYILIKEKQKFDLKKGKFWLYSSLAILFFMPVLLLYGKNIVQYKDLLPECEEVMTIESCMYNGVFRRDYGQSAGITVFSKKGLEMVSSWKWNPVKFFLIWSTEMNNRIYGIMAHKGMFIPFHLHFTFAVFPLSFAFLFLKKFKKREKMDVYMLIILLFYTFVLAFIQNYSTYLNRDGIIFALQGRYIFPVISIYYILLVNYMAKIENKGLRRFAFIFLIILFLLACIPFFLFSVTPEWFV